jgi:predicted component of type VI protein secretion system
MVSGEHCVITNEFGNWVIRHVSKTNQTMYNNMILGANEPNLLENGKTLTLANAVSFTVRIG